MGEFIRFDGYNSMGIGSKPESIRIYDTTLRDGEQSPGIALSVDDKVDIAQALDDYGVDCIEAGFAIANDVDRKVLKRLSEMNLNAEIYSLARCVKKDIDAVAECGIKNIHLFIATSELHLRYKLNMTREEVLSKIGEAVSYAAGMGMNVMFSCEDGTRTEYDFLKKAFDTAVKAGASVINLPDTVGAITPRGMFELISMLKRDFDVPVSVHCHNDLGLAVANSLAAIDAGAEIVHTCVNGLGERSGNASTEEVALNINLVYGIKKINLALTEMLSKKVVRYTGYNVAYTKPLVGRNAFSHEAGIHVHGVLNNAATYEPYPPEMVGRRRDISIGRHSGEHSVMEKLKGMGIPFPEDKLPALMKQIKDISAGDRKIIDIELAAIAENIIWKGRTEENVRLTEFVVLTGKNITPTATVTVDVCGRLNTCSMIGSGPIDAAVNAIKSAMGNKIVFEELRLESITGGSDSLCEVTVLIRDLDRDGKISAGKAVGLDIVDTTVDAIMQAINRDFSEGA